MKLYGQEYPPKYNLSATRVPAAFFIGPSDSMITKPVSMLSQKLLFPEIHLRKIIAC